MGAQTLSGTTRVFAVLGRPARHSKSPALFNAWFAERGLDAVYVALEPTAGDIGAWLTASGLAGANLTAPFKTAVLSGLVGLTAEAEAVGAVNTAWPTPSGWMGHNTDPAGIVATLDEQTPGWQSMSAAVLGAGGAARAAVLALVRRGVPSICVVARNPSKAAWALQYPQGSVQPWQTPVAQLVVDCTSGDGAAAAALGPTDSTRVWFDLTYSRHPSPIQSAVGVRGAHFVDGTTLLQHVARFSLDTFLGATG